MYQEKKKWSPVWQFGSHDMMTALWQEEFYRTNSFYIYVHLEGKRSKTSYSFINSCHPMVQVTELILLQTCFCSLADTDFILITMTIIILFLSSWNYYLFVEICCQGILKLCIKQCLLFIKKVRHEQLQQIF